jgi:1-acyl-sn-glycerol-3-phosphate acyltransferase
VYPLLAFLADRYFRSEVEGIDQLTDGPFMLVATHNGGMATPDLYCLMVAFWRRFGLETPAYGLMHRMAFRVPLFASFLRRLGAIPASRDNAALVLRNGFPLLVCPGGDVDSLKPFRQRHRVMFGPRRGFIRVALRQQIPIIPVVSVGAHETLLVLNDGRWLAEVTGAAKHFRIKSIPLSLSFPFGLGVAGLGSIPLPSKIQVRVLSPIRFAEPPGAADDPAAVERCFESVRGTMQAGLDDLASRRRRIILG